jgi:hypothetical protein
MKKLSMCLTAVMLVICAGTAFIAFSNDGLFGGIVRGAGNVATSAAETVVDAPERLVTGQPLIQREGEVYGDRDDMIEISDELNEDGDDED